MALRFDTTRYGPRAHQYPGWRPASPPRQSHGVARRWSSSNNDGGSRSAHATASRRRAAPSLLAARLHMAPDEGNVAGEGREIFLAAKP